MVQCTPIAIHELLPVSTAGLAVAAGAATTAFATAAAFRFRRGGAQLPAVGAGTHAAFVVIGPGLAPLALASFLLLCSGATARVAHSGCTEWGSASYAFVTASLLTAAWGVRETRRPSRWRVIPPWWWEMRGAHTPGSGEPRAESPAAPGGDLSHDPPDRPDRK